MTIKTKIKLFCQNLCPKSCECKKKTDLIRNIGSKVPLTQQQVFSSCLNQFGIDIFSKLSNDKGIYFLEFFWKKN
jgi:hypothetical protein